VAIRYLNRTRAILGRANVTMAMQRDPRVPASPMRIIVEEQFRFPTGSFAVDPKYAGLLNLGVIALKSLPEARLVVTGYTDNVGSADVNQSLSEQRAQVVVDWMVKGGIPANRVIALGRGPADPIATNSTPAGRQKNRRIEATVEGITP
jgi:outer membrane protein OmpA-like peptidoglycan-associated protein